MFQPTHALVALLLFSTLLCGFAPAVAPAEGDPSDSTRLRLDLIRVPLADLCWVLKKRSGIPHAPADAATGDLTLFAVGEMTVAELREAVAETLGVRWKEEGDAPGRRWVVERVPASLVEEARIIAERDRSLRDGLREMVAAAGLPEEERKKLPRRLASGIEGHLGDSTRLLGALSPEDQSRLLAGDPLVYPVSALSPAARTHLAAIAAGLSDSAAQFVPPPHIRMTREPRRLDLDNGERWSVRIGPSPYQLTGVAVYHVALFSPTNPGMGSAVNVGVPDLFSKDPRGYRLSRSAAGVEVPGSARVPEGYEAPRAGPWDEILRSLRQALQRPIVSDAYIPDFVGPGRAAVRPGATQETFLDRWCRAWGRRWGSVNGVLTFQAIDWPLKRRTQVSEAMVRRWRAHIMETGRVALTDLTEMAALPPPQKVAVPWIVAGLSDAIAEHRDLLLLWRSLPAATRDRLSQGGLFLRDLLRALQPRATALLADTLGTPAPLVLANARMRVEQTEDAFAFSVLVPERSPVTRRLDLRVRPESVQHLKQEEERRAAALRAAAGVP